ncbi:MAG: TIGR01212 family radical SAM protein [Bacteroidota bacterium]
MYPWGNTRRFNSYTNWSKDHFGSRMQKVSIDAGFSCPNRNDDRSGGCIYCNNSAFSPSYCDPGKTITQQIDEGIKFIAWRYRRATKHIAYFQSYSNTHASIDKLEKMYMEALAHPGISGLAIGTRPDCVNEEILELLSSLSRDSFIQLEFGVESVFDKTLMRINRGHTFECSANAVKSAAAKGLYTGVHLILGLPGEGTSEAIETAKTISQLPVHSLKVHQLQIIRDTKLAEEFQNNPESIHLNSMDEYIDMLIAFLENLNPEICIERMTAEVPPRFLIAPDWGRIRSDEVLRIIEQRMEDRNTWQGRCC